MPIPKVPNLFTNSAYEIKTFNVVGAGIVGALVLHVPVLDTGVYDPLRNVMFFGEAIITLSNGQQQPVRFPVHADSMGEAVAEWPTAFQDELTRIDAEMTRARILAPGPNNRSRS